MVLAIGCAPKPTPPVPPREYAPPADHMPLDQAAKIIQDWRASARPGPSPAAVSSLVEVREILRADDIDRFASAQSFAQGQGGPEALTLRSALEVNWAAGQITIARILDELAKRTSVEVHRLEAQLQATPDATLQTRFDTMSKDVERLMGGRDALLALAQPHLDAGLDLFQEALRTSPLNPGPHHAAALYYLIVKDWSGFDHELEILEAGEPNPLIDYLRGMESAQRNLDRPGGRERLGAALLADPGLVRVQADLVLLQDDVAARHDELENLRAVQPNHPLVMIAGPEIDAEFQIAQQLGPVPQ